MDTVKINGVHHRIRRMAIEKVNCLFDEIENDKEESDGLISLEDKLSYIYRNKPHNTNILIRDCDNSENGKWFVHFMYGNQLDRTSREIYSTYTNYLDEALRAIIHIIDFQKICK